MSNTWGASLPRWNYGNPQVCEHGPVCLSLSLTGIIPSLAGNPPLFAEKGETSSTLPLNLTPWKVKHTWRQIKA